MDAWNFAKAFLGVVPPMGAWNFEKAFLGVVPWKKAFLGVVPWKKAFLEEEKRFWELPLGKSVFGSCPLEKKRFLRAVL